jgi:hypothetical protein
LDGYWEEIGEEEIELKRRRERERGRIGEYKGKEEKQKKSIS